MNPNISGARVFTSRVCGEFFTLGSYESSKNGDVCGN